MTKLINITAPEHRCDISVSCPAVYRSEDGKTFTIIGKSGDPRNLPEGVAVGDHEEIIEISAEIVLAALGFTGLWTPEMRRAAMQDAQNICDLIEAARPIIAWLDDAEADLEEDEGYLEDWDTINVPVIRFRALRSIINRIKGGVNG